VVIVDVVTSRTANLHQELLAVLGVSQAQDYDLFAAAYRTLPEAERLRLEAWSYPLAVGDPLPTVPLWLAPELSLPLDLEGTYATTCDSLRIGTRH
jgi:hypothetical protein